MDYITLSARLGYNLTFDHNFTHLLEPASQFYAPLITKVLTFKSENVGVAWEEHPLKQFKIFKKYIV